MRLNPTGTLLVNPGGLFSGIFGKKSKAARKSKSKARASRKSGKRSASRRSNPKSAARRSHKKSTARRGHKRSASKAKARRNPILVNPILVNPMKGLGGILAVPANLVKRFPIVGGALGTAILSLGGALTGAVGSFGLVKAMGYLGGYFPSWLKPYGYTVAGAVAGGVLKAIPLQLPMKNELSASLAAAGGAVDAYRYLHGKSQDLGEMAYYGDTETGDAEMGDAFGDADDGAPLASVEFADASLADAQYAGDDFSEEELAAIELGRRNFRRRFIPANRQPQPPQDGSASDHAGKPGRRFGWLAYWIGHDNMQKLAALPPDQRREFIAKMKHEAHLRARKLLAQGNAPTVQEAETAGLLVAA